MNTPTPTGPGEEDVDGGAPDEIDYPPPPDSTLAKKFIAAVGPPDETAANIELALTDRFRNICWHRGEAIGIIERCITPLARERDEAKAVLNKGIGAGELLGSLKAEEEIQPLLTKIDKLQAECDGLTVENVELRETLLAFVDQSVRDLRNIATAENVVWMEWSLPANTIRWGEKILADYAALAPLVRAEPAVARRGGDTPPPAKERSDAP